MTIYEPAPFPYQNWKKISPEAKAFVESKIILIKNLFYLQIYFIFLDLLHKDPSQRMTIKEALEHKWFQIHNECNLTERRKSKDLSGSTFKLYTSTELI